MRSLPPPWRCPTTRRKVQRIAVIDVEAFDWNCPQHITPRYTLDEIESV